MLHQFFSSTIYFPCYNTILCSVGQIPTRITSIISHQITCQARHTYTRNKHTQYECLANANCLLHAFGSQIHTNIVYDFFSLPRQQLELKGEKHFYYHIKMMSVWHREWVHAIHQQTLLWIYLLVKLSKACVMTEKRTKSTNDFLMWEMMVSRQILFEWFPVKRTAEKGKRSSLGDVCQTVKVKIKFVIFPVENFIKVVTGK